MLIYINSMTLTLLHRLIYLTLGLAFLVAGAAWAGKPQKVIDFEDEVVEGLNKRPLDSLSQISERDRRKRRPHLYRKRVSFKSEVQQALQEWRSIP